MATRSLFLIPAVWLLAACSGSGGKAPPEGFPEPDRTASSIVMVSDTPTIPADGSQPATITVIARDASNVLLPNVIVYFAASSGGITASPATTNEVGEATAVLTTAADPTPRVIAVQATTAKGGLSATVNVTVQ